jgi:hypothetical protein
VAAWDLEEGAELPDGITVVALHRDALARTVRVVTSEPASAVLPADAPVPVVRR